MHYLWTIRDEQKYFIMVVNLNPTCVLIITYGDAWEKVHEEENWKWTFQNPWKSKLHVIDGIHT
jgi:hypothetical protein